MITERDYEPICFGQQDMAWIDRRVAEYKHNAQHYDANYTKQDRPHRWRKGLAGERCVEHLMVREIGLGAFQHYEHGYRDFAVGNIDIDVKTKWGFFPNDPKAWVNKKQFDAQPDVDVYIFACLNGWYNAVGVGWAWKEEVTRQPYERYGDGGSYTFNRETMRPLGALWPILRRA